jgi:hypothetical protein
MSVPSLTTTWSPMTESTTRQPGKISQPVPTVVRPDRVTPGWITVSGPTVTPAST